MRLRLGLDEVKSIVENHGGYQLNAWELGIAEIRGNNRWHC